MSSQVGALRPNRSTNGGLCHVRRYHTTPPPQLHVRPLGRLLSLILSQQHLLLQRHVSANQCQSMSANHGIMVKSDGGHVAQLIPDVSHPLDCAKLSHHQDDDMNGSHEDGMNRILMMERSMANPWRV